MAIDAWIVRLKDAYDAGYYKTEAASEEQAVFPWRSKTCKDCPFWSNNICQVHADFRASTAHTCTYFDEPNREEGQRIIAERQREGFRRWWEWFNGRRASH